jgi:hypothetical protein
MAAHPDGYYMRDGVQKSTRLLKNKFGLVKAEDI